MHYSSLFHQIYRSATVPILVENSFYYFKYDDTINLSLFVLVNILWANTRNYCTMSLEKKLTNFQCGF